MTSLALLLKNKTLQILLFAGLTAGSIWAHYLYKHPSVVIMHIDGQEVESKVLDYAPACSTRNKLNYTPVPENSSVPDSSPVRSY